MAARQAWHANDDLRRFSDPVAREADQTKPVLDELGKAAPSPSAHTSPTTVPSDPRLRQPDPASTPKRSRGEDSSMWSDERRLSYRNEDNDHERSQKRQRFSSQ